MHLDDLGLFLRVAHARSLSEAARQLDHTPASVSARLKRIEEELREIAARYAEWEISGPPEIRDADPGSASFNPYRNAPEAELKRLQEPAPQLNPHLERPPAIDATERFLTTVFLRSYVTYCARHRRLREMQGAARLLAEIGAAAVARSTSLRRPSADRSEGGVRLWDRCGG